MEESILSETIKPKFEEKLSKEQALFFIMSSVWIAAFLAYFAYKRQEAERQKYSFNMRYKFTLPPEKQLFEEKISQEPEDEQAKVEWHKECCSILLRRAILDLSMHIQVSKDFQHHSQMYHRGITLDIWPEIKKARQLLNSELETVKMEAENLKAGWGETIFQQAAQLKNHLDAMAKKQEEEKARALELEKKKKREEKLKAAEEKRKKEAEESDKKKREKLAQELILEEEKTKSKAK